MTAGLSIDLRSAVPPFEQIRAQIAALISAGALEPGAHLPTMRRLAADLGIAAGTVARAYRELEHAGLVETGRRKGTTVATSLPPGASPGGAGVEVEQAADRLIAAARSAHLDDAAVLELVRGRLSGTFD